MQITSDVLSYSRQVRLENSSEMPIEGLCVAVSTRERDQLSSFTEVTEVIVICSDIDTMKTTVPNKGVIEACNLIQRNAKNYRGALIVHWVVRTSRAELGPSSGPGWKRTCLELKTRGPKMRK